MMSVYAIWMMSVYAIRVMWHLQLQPHTPRMFDIKARHTSIDLQDAGQMLSQHQQSAAKKKRILLSLCT